MIELASKSGDTRTVDVPAGFTAFIPAETENVAPHSAQYRASIKAVENTRFKTPGCDEADTAGKQNVDKKGNRSELGLNIVLHNGTTLVQGLWIVVSCLMYLTLATGHDYFVEVTLENSATETPHQYQASVSLERDVIVEGSPILVDDDEQSIFRGEFNFREIYADIERTQTTFSDWAQFPLATPFRAQTTFSDWARFPLATPVRRSVGKTYPRTSLNQSSLAPFEIRSFLVVSIAELRNATSVNPLPPNEVWVSGDQSKTEKPVETGWEFGECDLAHYHTRHYKARIPVTILGYDADVVHSEPWPVSYLHDSGHVAAPRVLSGHVATSKATFKFDMAEPMVARETAKTASPGDSGRDLFGTFGGMRSIDAKAGHYVGALWHRKVAEEKMSRASSMESFGSQTVFEDQSL
jgi:hypothetical protein